MLRAAPPPFSEFLARYFKRLFRFFPIPHKRETFIGILILFSALVVFDETPWDALPVGPPPRSEELGPRDPFFRFWPFEPLRRFDIFPRD